MRRLGWSLMACRGDLQSKLSDGLVSSRPVLYVNVIHEMRLLGQWAMKNLGVAVDHGRSQWTVDS